MKHPNKDDNSKNKENQNKDGHKPEGHKTTLMMRWHSIPLRWRIFAYLLSFAVIMVCLLWLFQIVYLDQFYERIKTDAIRQTAAAMQENIESEHLEDSMADLAQQRQICISLYRVHDNSWKVNMELVCSADILGDCIIHHVGNDNIANYYISAKAEGGLFSERISRSAFSMQENDQGRFWEPRDIGLPDSLVYASLINDSAGQTYLLLLNSSISPVTATVSTLRLQLMYISAILVILALLLSVVIANRLSRPISRINKAARSLARGDFSRRFDGGGYREINELAETLNYAAAELARSEKLQSDIVANISHDLRTPLTMIGGYAEYMRDFPDEDKSESLDVIISETERLNRLVSDVLDYSRLHSGVERLQRTEFELSESLRDFVSRYNALLEPEGFHIGLEIDGDISIFADEARIMQALGNMLNNALTHAGADKMIEVTQSCNKKSVRITVRDRGPGIPEEDLPHIWDRYYHADAPGRAGHSSGLGLSIVKGIMELHQARYGVENIKDGGCAFWFELDL